MIIDVKNINLKRLLFNRQFDPLRHKRGKEIYQEELVSIIEADDEGNGNYDIFSAVEGNSATYEVELKIRGNMIYDSRCSCYDYINGNLCKHILATSLEVINPHKSSCPGGREEYKKWKEEERQKEIERQKREQEEQKRRIMYETLYFNGLTTLEQYKRRLGSSTNNVFNLDEIYTNANYIKKHENLNNELATNLKLEYTINLENRDGGALEIAFKIGNKRMYVLNNVLEFYRAYVEKRVIRYGKTLSLIPKRENFDQNSKEIFDFIIKYAKMIDYVAESDQYIANSLPYKVLILSNENVDEFFDLNKNNSLMTKSNGRYEFTDEKLDVHAVLKKETIDLDEYSYGYNYYMYKYSYNMFDDKMYSEEYTLSLNIDDFKTIYSKDKIYVFFDGKIYILEKNDSYINLFKMFEDDRKILIPQDKLNEYKEFVFSKIKYVKIESWPEEKNEEPMIVDNLASKILLDLDDEDNILLELKFCYLEYEFNVLEKGYTKYVEENHIVRDIPSETEVIKRIFMDGFSFTQNKKEFILKKEEDIYIFLSEKIKGYMEDFEVLVTEKFKNRQIRQPKISNIGVRIDNGLLELDISKMNIDIKEIKNVLKEYQVKKKYYKLKNGDFLNLNESTDLNLLDEMAITLDVDYSKMNSGLIKIPVNRSIYLESLLNSNKDINVSKNKQFTELIDSITNTEISNNIKISDDFEDKLRDYQKVGYKWLKTLELYKFGGILADDMGLGKTLQIIAVLKSNIDNENSGTSIVVCPSTLVLNWKAEVEKWCDSLKVLIIKGTANERKELINEYNDYDLVITSYDLLKRDVENYEDKYFKYIIADEAQYIKNSTTQNATSLKSLQGEIKYALTGTPIENSVAELWSIFDFIMPGYLYNYHKFKKKFEEPILKHEDKEALARLKKLISPFVLRRVKQDVLSELPEKNITILKNEMSDEQNKIYLSYLAQTQKEVAEELSSESNFAKSKFKILMLLTRLRQICCHPSLFIKNYNGESGKLTQCINLIVDAIDAGHKVLLFSSYTSMFEIIEKELVKRNINYFKLIGKTPVGERIEMVDEFNKNESVKLFLISLKAGGTGLNLTSADIVIHYDPWWNVSSENQATDRAYRIGQKNSVQVYKLITNNTIEEKINKMQERKEKLSNDILSTKETFINQMSKEDILDLFK